MKKLLVFSIILMTTLTLPVSASVNCLDNSKHLQENFDTKEWYPADCDCPCTTIKGGYCIECGHLQDARTYTVVSPQKTAPQKIVYIPSDPKMTFKKLALKYVQKKK